MTITEITPLELIGTKRIDGREYILEGIEELPSEYQIILPNTNYIRHFQAGYIVKRFGWVYINGKYSHDWVQYV